ncbi:uncharacterized protein UV8b_02785 [Ustilaginoidea virens]|uniref:GDP/GTP exchange factor Sec2 N-terminal domain-containing protein n=1 Tax=Ustilaginoidea virens TaxID=1159556 RepID=A0A8E5HN53_USTVR|nr:uncharacterized protein UV8b_02785 [Ustilaginoidea virens]QUC18544.1 hypothetical protein UV8b_02785 [Ustilaginoidea virens]
MAVLTTSPARIASPAFPPPASPDAACPRCGSSRPHDLTRAQARIAELEAQVAQLTNKAAQAVVSRWADCEAQLRAPRSQPPSTPAQAEPAPPSPTTTTTTTTSLLQRTSRLSSFLYARKPTPALRVDVHRQNSLPLPNLHALASPAASPTPSAEDLIEALTREKTLRQEAEGRLTSTSKEVEELSASLFEQANEMVADERRARAKLEERVDELEKRDKEKRRRLERLEGALERIEKVRRMLDE